jgi:hypothetical protein
VKRLLIAAALLLSASLFLPLWSTHMESPQYHGEDEIVINVYPSRIVGSLREVQTLNQYIGVHLPLDAPELRALPYALCGFLAMTLGAIFMPWRIQKNALPVNLVLMPTGGLAGAVMLQYRLYHLGHVRTHSIMKGVPNFTPPIIGSMQLANFHIETRLMIGAWAFALAIVLTGLAVYFSRHETVRMPSFSALRRVG